MKLLLTSGGVTNDSIRAKLEELLGKPIAQSRALGHGFARIWMHNGMLSMQGSEMHKSIGNDVSLKDALDRWGAGAGSSRLVVGARPVHSELELALADWKHTDAAVLFPTGFAANLGVIGAPIGLFFGRCANFVNGELWGKETDLPWGVMFETGGAVYRHPSQLYEAVLEGLVIFAVLYALSRRVPPRPQGTFMGAFLTLYGIFRFLVEFVRVPDAQLGYLLGPITMGQLLSLPLVLLGVAVLVGARRLNRPQRGYLEE